MRVLHLGKFWPPYAGGVEQFAGSLVQQLARSDVHVDVLAHAAPGDAGSHGREGESTVELVRCFGQVAYAPASPGFPFALRRMLRQNPPDLLHLHMPNPAAFWTLLLPAARKLPSIVHWHSDIPVADAPAAVRLAYPFYRYFERSLLKRAKAIIATSPEYRDASEPLASHHDKTRVIPLGIGTTPEPAGESVAAARSLWNGGGLRLLAVGRLSHYKGFDQLLDALARTAGVSLVLIGDGECRQALERQVRELGIGERVRLTGSLQDAERDAAYAAAQAFCLPSTARSEAFGLVLLEAMRARLPIVASNVAGSGMAHVLDHGRTGIMVPPANPQALAAALVRLAESRTLRDQLAEAGQARWRQHFDLVSVADATVNLYRELLPKAR